MKYPPVCGLLALAILGACATGGPGPATVDGAADDDAMSDGGGPPIDSGAPVNLTLAPTGPGSMSVEPSGTSCGADCTTHPSGTSLTITATPIGGATITGWSVPCASSGTGTSCTFVIDDDLTVGVEFVANFVPTSFAFTGAAQTYTVPVGATGLQIVADGASGGDTGIYTGGRGAHVVATVPASGGQQLTIIVGQQPAVNTAGSDGCGASGGGGTFVALGSTALVVAGGGGGAAGYSSFATNGGPASLTANGTSSNSLAGGSGGNGGPGASAEGGGGGGMLTPGGAGTGGATGGQSFNSGSAGGIRATTESCGTIAGGFGGGGGGGNDMGGGGGGYSGGAAQDSSSSGFSAGGGGSYASVTPTITLRAEAGHGSVTITPE